jgi:purine-binding chemotaxis protein CheW
VNVVDSPNPSGLYLAFHLGSQLYGVPVAAVREILPMVEITLVPNAPAFVRGVINLRGTIVPVLDLRLKLGLSGTVPGPATGLVVVDDPALPFGFLADRVSDCVEIGKITRGEGETGPEAVRRFVDGMGQLDGRIILLLALNRLLTAEDRRAIAGL